MKLRDNVERWLIHENYRFKNVKNDENSFCLRIKDVGSFGIPIEIATRGSLRTLMCLILPSAVFIII